MKELVSGLYGSGVIKSEAYTRYRICKEMGWDYYTYMAQPPFFLEEINLIRHHEVQKEQHDAKQLERTNNGIGSNN